MEEDLLGICGFDSSKKYRLEELAKYQSGSCIEFEDDDEMAVDYPCPFCSDDYDLVELCHHIDEEHQLDANNGICPVCSRRVKMHMVDHITTQHRDVFKRLYKDESYSAFSPGTRKYLQSLIDEPLSTNHTSKSVLDPLLSFIYNPPSPKKSKLVQPDSSSEASMEDNSLIRDSTEKDWESPSPLSDTELLEKAKKREFVQAHNPQVT
ncbi:Drought-responsive family protein [Arabidopsis thaliana]|uniref:Isoform 2 of Protein DEHYDRATION-INDUCED 19 homolog 5 n=1 Tax=Arabidopsis thaliana TaxID=3702 RepID=O04259-2|nr:Drought-responsive family protein [Arabidopsis thaliana]AEE82138.1 Drought-responsive family protein [Arabidopsis thaliana]|eukprot:NP_849286.1 Drought-responsive family protein [Arabidopsis thaliana]